MTRSESANVQLFNYLKHGLFIREGERNEKEIIYSYCIGIGGYPRTHNV